MHKTVSKVINEHAIYLRLFLLYSKLILYHIIEYFWKSDVSFTSIHFLFYCIAYCSNITFLFLFLLNFNNQFNLRLKMFRWIKFIDSVEFMSSSIIIIIQTWTSHWIIFRVEAFHYWLALHWHSYLSHLCILYTMETVSFKTVKTIVRTF